MVRIDLKKCTADMLVPEAELEKRRMELAENGGFSIPESHSPRQQYFREKIEPFSQGMVLKGAPDYRDIAKKHIPRNNH